MTAEPISAGQRAERLAALTNYVLLVIAPFSLGGLAVLAIAIAYLRRDRADAFARGHYDYQIRRFWLDLGIVAVGALCGLAAIAGGIGTLAATVGIALPLRANADHAGLLTLGLAAAWAILWVWGIFGLVLGSAFGAMRLASGRPAGKRRRS